MLCWSAKNKRLGGRPRKEELSARKVRARIFTVDILPRLQAGEDVKSSSASADCIEASVPGKALTTSSASLASWRGGVALRTEMLSLSFWPVAFALSRTGPRHCLSTLPVKQTIPPERLNSRGGLTSAKHERRAPQPERAADKNKTPAANKRRRPRAGG